MIVLLTAAAEVSVALVVAGDAPSEESSRYGGWDSAASARPVQIITCACREA